MATQAWDRYFLGPPPRAKAPETKAVRFSDQPPGRSYDDIIAAHQSPPRLGANGPDETEPLADHRAEPFEDHYEDAVWTPEEVDVLRLAVRSSSAPPCRVTIEQYVNTIVTNRLAGMQLSPVNTAIAEDQLRATRRKQILGMTT